MAGELQALDEIKNGIGRAERCLRGNDPARALKIMRELLDEAIDVTREIRKISIQNDRS